MNIMDEQIGPVNEALKEVLSALVL